MEGKTNLPLISALAHLIGDDHALFAAALQQVVWNIWIKGLKLFITQVVWTTVKNVPRKKRELKPAQSSRPNEYRQPNQPDLNGLHRLLQCFSECLCILNLSDFFLKCRNNDQREAVSENLLANEADSH